MRLNRDVLIQAIILHQSSFFRLLDYIDSHDGSNEFPANIYMKLYQEICQKENDTNICNHLSIASLLENGVFIHNDNNTGFITVESVIIELLRFLDVKRVRELTNIDLEQLRKRTLDAKNDVIASPFATESYQDALSAFNRLLSEIHSRIKANVASLTAQVETISNDYTALYAGESDQSVFDLYEKVSTLYSRYVVPCYEFIDPAMDMAKTETFSKAVQGLIDYHSEKVDAFEVATTLQFRKTAITSYYKDIESLERKLRLYSNQLESDRRYFLSIEGAYAQLMEALVPLRHGKQRNKYLTKDSPILQSIHSLDGLSEKKKTYSPRFNWPEANIARLRFKEYLNLIERQQVPDGAKRIKTPLTKLNVEEERKIEISQLIFSSPMPSSIACIHHYLQDLLSEGLSNFGLADVLYGLESILPSLNQSHIHYVNEYDQIEDDFHYFKFLPISYKSVEV